MGLCRVSNSPRDSVIVSTKRAATDSLLKFGGVLENKSANVLKRFKPGRHPPKAKSFLCNLRNVYWLTVRTGQLCMQMSQASAAADYHAWVEIDGDSQSLSV